MIAAIVMLQLSLVSCECSHLDNTIKAACEADSVWYDITDLLEAECDWDSVYVISGPYFYEEMMHDLEMEKRFDIGDDERGILFVKDGRVIEYQVSRCHDIQWTGLSATAVGHRIYAGQTVQVRRGVIENRSTYHIRVK